MRIKCHSTSSGAWQVLTACSWPIPFNHLCADWFVSSLNVFIWPSPRPTLRDRVVLTSSSGRHVDGLLPIRHSHSGLAVPRSLSPVLASVDFIAGLHFRRGRGHDLNRGISPYKRLYSPGVGPSGFYLAIGHDWCASSQTDRENSFHYSWNDRHSFLFFFQVSLLLLAFMSMERFLCIASPFGYTKLNQKTAKISLVLIWGLGLIMAIVPGK